MIQPPFPGEFSWGSVESAPWALCEDPSQWSNLGNGFGGVEVEVLYFLRALVPLLHPRLIVETGTFTGASAAMLALGCQDQGFGRVVTYEIDAGRAEAAREFIARQRLTQLVDVRHEDAAQAAWGEGLIDLFFCDGGDDREREVRHFMRYFSARCIVVGHDGAAHQAEYGALRDAGFVQIMLPTAVGLVLLQRRGA